MTEQTAFQRLLPDDEEELRGLVDDLRNPERIVPDGQTMDDLEGMEMALVFTEGDIPAMLEEAEAMLD